MKKEMKNKRKKKILFYFFFSCLAFFTTDFTTTSSKYKLEKDNAIIYSNQLYKVYNDTPLSISGALKDYTNNSQVAVEFMFHPNDQIGANADDNLYFIEVPTPCSITVIPTSNVLYHNGDYTQIKIKDQVSVRLICARGNPEIENQNQYTIKVTIYEKVGTEKRFIYQTGIKTFTSLVEEEKPEPSVPKDAITITTSDASELYQQLDEWLTSYFEYYYKELSENNLLELKTKALDQYILCYKNGTCKEPLLGLKETVEGDRHTFTIEENLSGYIRTQYVNGLFLYFSTDDSDTIYRAMQYYLENYIYAGREVPISEIMDYLKANHFDTFVTKGSGNFPEGLFYPSQDVDSFLYVDSDLLLQYASEFVSGEEDSKGEMEIPPISDQPQDHPSIEDPSVVENEIVFSSQEDMLTSFESYMSHIQDIYPSYLLSDSVVESMVGNPEIRASISQNDDLTEEKMAFQDYFLVLDEVSKQYFVVHVSSLGAQSNVIEVDPLEIPLDMVGTVAWKNEKDWLEVTLTMKEIPVVEENQGEDQSSFPEEDSVLFDQDSLESVREEADSDQEEEIETNSKDDPLPQDPVVPSTVVTEEEWEKMKNMVTLLDQYFQKMSVWEDHTFGTTRSSIQKENGVLTLTYRLEK